MAGLAVCFCVLAGFRKVSLLFLDVCAKVNVLANFFIGINSYGGRDGYCVESVGGLCCAVASLGAGAGGGWLAVGFVAKTDLHTGMWRWGGCMWAVGAVFGCFLGLLVSCLGWGGGISFKWLAGRFFWCFWAQQRSTGLKTKFGGQLQVPLAVFKELVSWYHDVAGVYEKVNGNTFHIMAGLLSPLPTGGGQLVDNSKIGMALGSHTRLLNGGPNGLFFIWAKVFVVEQSRDMGGALTKGMVDHLVHKLAMCHEVCPPNGPV